MEKKLCVLACLLAVSFMAGWSQTISMRPPEIVPVSPEAANVQRYASYPVDYSTGIPDIRIPLYEIKVGDIVLPITLSYHSAGLKPKEPSGRVGTGWTLNAEPSVMRSIRGLVDNTYSASSHQIPSSREDIRKLIDGEKDGESDLYSYFLNPGGGTCYSGYAYTLYSYPKNNDKIEYKGDSITITNGNGFVYHFGSGDYAKEKTRTNSGLDVITRWMCDRINSLQTGAEIRFSYQSGFPLYLDNTTHDLKIIEYQDGKPYNQVTEINEQAFTYELHSDGTMRNSAYISGSNTVPFNYNIVCSSLHNISFNGHNVTFSYRQCGSNDCINEMIVTDSQGNQIRSVTFFVTPYNENMSSINTLMLTKLDSIRIAAPGCEARTYHFNYYNPGSAPSIQTKSIDHWGFYNGNSNARLVPTIYTRLTYVNGFNNYFTQKDTIEGANRDPNASYAKTGVLKQIIHPEGMVTDFEYEGNTGAFLMYYRGPVDYDKYAYYGHPVGGLRISKIEESILNTHLEKQLISVKQYKYGINPSCDYCSITFGGGVIKHIVTNRDYCFENTKHQSHTEPNCGDYNSYYVRTWYSMPVSNITFNNGSAVLYSFVQEDITDYKYGIPTATVTNKYYYEVPAASDSSFRYAALDGYGEKHTNAKGLLTGTMVMENVKTAQSIVASPGREVSTTYTCTAMYYDYKGQIIQNRKKYECGRLNFEKRYEEECLSYNFTGQPTKRKNTYSTISEHIGIGMPPSVTVLTEEYGYLYDHARRLVDTKHKLDGGTEIVLSHNTYDDIGRVISRMPDNNRTVEQQYEYNVRSWLTGIIGRGGGQYLYYNVPHNDQATPCWNGNVSTSICGRHCFDYSYDNLNRLTKAEYFDFHSTPRSYGENSSYYEYDRNGNILLSATLEGAEVMDLYYIYQGNQILSVEPYTDDYLSTKNVYANMLRNIYGLKISRPEYSYYNAFSDYSNGPYAFIEGYAYNRNGSLTVDPARQATYAYNLLGMPKTVTVPAVNGVITYTYDAAGNKCRADYAWHSGLSLDPVENTGKNYTGTNSSRGLRYVGNKVYENNALKMILFDNGYIQDGMYHFYFRDHLGNNIRTWYRSSTSSSQYSQKQETFYHPFGKPISGKGKGESVQPYKYGGKEEETMLGLAQYDFIARRMDYIYDRFLTMDPLCEKYPWISPYVYCGNNPIRNIDLKGDSITVLNLGSWTDQHMGILIQNNDGKWQYYSVNGDNVYNATGGLIGGRPFDDLAVGEWDSPQQFMDSQYNQSNGKEGKIDTSINSYGYSEGYILPTTPEQDNAIRSTFTSISENEDYSLISNNCATAVQRSLNAVGISTTTARKETDAFVSTPPKVYNSWIPSEAFRAIRTNNPQGVYINRR